MRSKKQPLCDDEGGHVEDYAQQMADSDENTQRGACRIYACQPVLLGYTGARHSSLPGIGADGSVVCRVSRYGGDVRRYAGPLSFILDPTDAVVLLSVGPAASIVVNFRQD